MAASSLFCRFQSILLSGVDDQCSLLQNMGEWVFLQKGKKNRNLICKLDPLAYMSYGS